MEGWVTRETLIERFDEVERLFWWAFENKIKNTRQYRAFRLLGNTARDLNILFWLQILRNSQSVSHRLALSTYIVNNAKWSMGHECWKVFDEKRGVLLDKCSIDEVEDIEETRYDDKELVDQEDLCQQASRWVDGRTWAVVKGRFVEERSLEDLGKELKITRERVRQIQDKGLQRIKNSKFGKKLEKDVYFPNDCG